MMRHPSWGMSPATCGIANLVYTPPCLEGNGWPNAKGISSEVVRHEESPTVTADIATGPS
jgi:hypothetical protein